MRPVSGQSARRTGQSVRRLRSPESKEQNRRQDRTERVGKHVFLGVPHIALTPQERRSCIATREDCVPPLDQLIAHRNERDGEDRKQKQNKPASDGPGAY